MQKAKEFFIDENRIEWQLLDAYKIVEKLKAAQNIYIYGAGMVGHNILTYIDENHLHDKVKNFLVSKLTDKREYIDDIEIVSVEHANITDEDIVVLAAKKNLRKEIKNICEQHQITNCLEIDVFDDKTEEYFSLIPDVAYPYELKERYRWTVGKELNLENPVTYNDKISWMMLYDRNPLKTKLADKYLAREWVGERIGEQYLVRLLGVWDRFDDIDFDRLPQKFVLKCNHGCGWNLIVKDKSQLDMADAKQKFDDWMSRNFAWAGLELQYRDIVPKIIAEEYLENIDGDLFDYKFWCFNGKVEFVMFLSERAKELRMNNYDKDWNLLSFTYDYQNSDREIKRPKNLEEMIRLAEKLAEGFNHVRVDFYQLNDGQIKFGEMTFTSACGKAKWSDEEINHALGKLILL